MIKHESSVFKTALSPARTSCCPGLILRLSSVSLEIEGRKIIRDLSWQVGDGENWVVIGPNGAGKTTLLRIVNGYLWPSSGRVSVLGEAFGRSDLRELRRRIGFVSAYLGDWIPSEERVIDVVVSGRYASTRLWKDPSSEELAYANRMLRRVGCERYRNAKVGKLSQGEKQKVVIARALMARPQLLTLDEPCAGLDLPGREQFLSSVGRIAESGSPAIIYVTHRVEEIPAGFTHALLVRGGRVTAKGGIENTLTSDNLSRCFQVPIRVSRRRNRFYAIIDR